MKIIRHRRGDKRSTYDPEQAFVCIIDANWCERMYFQFVRGYELNHNNVATKEIMSEAELQRRKLKGI